MREILWVIQQLQTSRLIGHPWQQSGWQLPGQWLLLKGLMIDPGSAKVPKSGVFGVKVLYSLLLVPLKCLLVSPHWSLCNFDVCIQLLPGKSKSGVLGSMLSRTVWEMPRAETMGPALPRDLRLWSESDPSAFCRPESPWSTAQGKTFCMPWAMNLMLFLNVNNNCLFVDDLLRIQP